MRTLLALLLLAAPTFGQGSYVQVSPSGVKRVGRTTVIPAGTSGPKVVVAPIAGVKAWYDASDVGTFTKGGYVGNNTSRYLSTSTVPVSAYPFSVAAWVRFSSSADVAEPVFCLRTGAVDYHMLYATSGSWKCESAATTAGTSTGATGVSGVYAHVVGVWASATSRTCYVNGVAGTTNTTNLAFGTPTTLELMRDNGQTLYFNGAILGVTLWNTALTSGEITDLAAGWDPRLIQRAGIVGDWPLDNALTGRLAGATLTNNNGATVEDNVVVWRDKAGPYHLITGLNTTTVHPTYVAAGLINGRPCVRFVTANNRLMSIPGSVPATAAPVQIYTLSACTQATTDAYVFGLENAATAANKFMHVYEATGDSLEGETNNSTPTRVIGGTFTVNTGVLIWTLDTSATNRECQVNGGTSGTDATSKTPSGINCVCMGGIESSSATSMTGDVTGAMVLTTTSLVSQPAIEAYYEALSAISIP